VDEINEILTKEAIRCRYKFADPQEAYRFEVLVQDAAKHLTPEAVQVAIEEHRLHSPFMPALCDLMEHSAAWRRDRAEQARRLADAQAARTSRAMLPAPSRLTDEDVRRMIDEIKAAPGPDGRPHGQRSAPDTGKWLKPPEHSDLSPELKALAIERGWVKVPHAA
jgi:hypothetical protein